MIKDKRNNLLRHLTRFKADSEKRLHLERLKSKNKFLSEEYVNLVDYQLERIERDLIEEILISKRIKLYDTQNSERYVSRFENTGNPDIFLTEITTCISRPTYWGNRGGDIRDYYLVNLKSKKLTNLESFPEVSPEAHFGQFIIESPYIEEKRIRYKIKDIATKNPHKLRETRKNIEDIF